MIIDKETQIDALPSFKILRFHEMSEKNSLSAILFIFWCYIQSRPDGIKSCFCTRSDNRFQIKRKKRTRAIRCCLASAMMRAHFFFSSLYFIRSFTDNSSFRFFLLFRTLFSRPLRSMTNLSPKNAKIRRSHFSHDPHRVKESLDVMKNDSIIDRAPHVLQTFVTGWLSTLRTLAMRSFYFNYSILQNVFLCHYEAR